MVRSNITTGKQIAAFTVYSAFERVLIVLSGMISLIILGRLGSLELAGNSIANTIINIFQAPFLSLGTAVMIAISSNEKRKRGLVLNSLATGLFVGFALILFLTFFSENIVGMLFSGTDNRIKGITVSYLAVYKWAIPFVSIDLITSGCMRGWKNAKAPLIVTIIGNLINIVLCFIFVHYMESGYIGGAYAQVISSAIVCIIKIVCVLKAFSEDVNMNPEKICFGEMFNIFSKSMPFFINLFFVRIGFLGMHVVTALLGTEVLTGYQVASNILSVIYAVTGGVEVSIIAFVSEFYHRNNYKSAKKTAYFLTGISMLVLSFAGVIIALNTPFFVGIFNRDVSTSEVALFVVRLMCVTIPFTSIFQCIQGVPNALNHAKMVTLSTILCIWCLRIPIAYFLVKNFNLGFIGLFIGFMADYLTRSIFYLFASMKILNRQKS